MAGYSRLWIAHVDEVQAVIIIDEKTRQAVFESLMDWAEIEADRIEFSNNYTDRRFEQTISGNFPGTNAGVETLLKKMCAGRYIVRMKDRAGQLWILGDKEQPLRFEYEHFGGATGADEHTYRIRFVRASTQPPYLTL